MKQIAAAFVKAQTAFGPALKKNVNPAFKGSKYADLAACVEAVMDALNANGIALMQHSHEVDSGVTIETVFLHESGEVLSSGKLHVPAAKHDAQGYGSAMTYARRYSLMAACGIAPEDDDGNAAVKAKADEQAQILQALRDASMGGTKALQAAFEKQKPPAHIWEANKASLKKAAAAADKPVEMSEVMSA